MKSKEQGNIALGQAIAYFTGEMYTVSVPLNDSQPYDLIVDMGGILYKVDCKSTRSETKAGSGVYRVDIRSTSIYTNKEFNPEIIDLLFIHEVATGVSYIYRTHSTMPKTGLTLNTEFKEKYKI